MERIRDGGAHNQRILEPAVRDIRDVAHGGRRRGLLELVSAGPTGIVAVVDPSHFRELELAAVTHAAEDEHNGDVRDPPIVLPVCARACPEQRQREEK